MEESVKKTQQHVLHMRPPKPLRKRVAENWQMYVFLLIPVVWLIIWEYCPSYGLTIAFKNYRARDGIIGSEWVGIEHFIKFFNSYQFGRVVGNTIVLSLLSMLTFPIPIAFALLLNIVQKKKYKSFIENVTYMPHFISTVVMVGILRRVFDTNTGIINNFIEQLFGIKYDLNMFMGGTNFTTLYIWSGVWQGTGWGSIIYMAALSSVDPEMHEAATIDGASRWKRILHIDLPTIMPTVVIMLIMRCSSIMGIGFDKVYLMQNDTNLIASEVISTYTYKVGLTAAGGSNFSYSAAIGMFNSIINLACVCFANFVANKVNGSGLW